MWIKSLSVQGFRALLDVSLVLDPKVTTLVGENGTGKSTTGMAMARLFGSLVSNLGGDQISREDYPYEVVGTLAMRASIQLTPSETERLLINALVPSGLQFSARERLTQWLRGFGSEIIVTLARPNVPGSSSLPPQVRWGDMTVWANLMRIGEDEILWGGDTRPWIGFARSYANGDIPAER